MAGRDLTSAFKTALTAAKLHPILLVKGQFDSGDLNLWSGIGDLSWNGDTWTGSGDLLTIDFPEETRSLEASGGSFTLSGVKSSILSVVLSEELQGRPCQIWLGAIDESTGNVIADPFQMVSALLDVPEIQPGADTCTITVSYEDDLIDLQRPRERRRTGEDQKLKYPDDTFFDKVSSLQDKEVVWGRKS